MITYYGPAPAAARGGEAGTVRIQTGDGSMTGAAEIAAK